MKYTRPLLERSRTISSSFVHDLGDGEEISGDNMTLNPNEGIIYLTGCIGRKIFKRLIPFKLALSQGNTVFCPQMFPRFTPCFTENFLKVLSFTPSNNLFVCTYKVMRHFFSLPEVTPYPFHPILAPSSEESAPRWEVSGATPAPYLK